MTVATRRQRLGSALSAGSHPWRFGLFVVSGWVVLSVLFSPDVQVALLYGRQPIVWRDLFFLSLVNTLIAAAFAPGIIWLTRRFPLEPGGWLRALAVHVPACFAFSFSHAFLYGMICFASQRLSELLFRRIQGNVVTYWAIVGFTAAMSYFAKVRERERELAQAQLELLRSQLQPHFLFNALNTIAAMMHDDVSAADRMIGRLSDLLRLTLDTIGSHETTLQHELDFVQTYVEIHRARFGPSPDLVVEAPAEARTALVPSMVLQPLVENALRHGFAGGTRGGRITIAARTAGESLVIEVRDNGRGLTPPVEQLREGLGLGNTRRRLLQLYPGRGRLAIGDGPDGGAIVTIELPLHFAPLTAELAGESVSA